MKAGPAEIKKRELGIYVHIPFCAKKCSYCDFLSFPAGVSVQERYFKALWKEIGSFGRAQEYEAVSIYFGGGTPSLPRPELITETLRRIKDRFPVRGDAEITIECNPGTMDDARLKAWKSAGFNRLSIGLQSADNDLLRSLGRIHTWETFLKEYEASRAAGFSNISVDLMYSLPGQTTAVWRDTLEKVCRLEPEHISAYSLIIEEGTPFWKQYHEDEEAKQRGGRPLFLPDEETEEEMLEELKSSVRDIGMHRYEISSYAKEGMESRHNTGYWLRREYAGFGLGASGQLEHFRYRNQPDLSRYLDGDNTPAEHTPLSVEEEMSETMILQLRMMRGVDLDLFEERFHERAQDRYRDSIEEFCGAGLLERNGNFLRLTDRGINLSNLVMCSFLE